MMTHDRTRMRLIRTSRRAAALVFAVWLSAAQSLAVGRPNPAAYQDEERANSTTKLADKEVLKLQAEKRDSIDRLGKTAAEIARKWRERQSQKDASKGGQSPKVNLPVNSSDGSAAANEASGKPSLQSSGTLPLEASSVEILEAPAAGDAMPADENSSESFNGAAEGSVDTGTELQSKTGMQSDPEIQVASVASIVDGPIDRLALATSLYATDQFRECLKILEAVELRPLSVEDRQWHDYLGASCHRKLGDRSEAEAGYRSVLQRSSSTWVSAAARWWLGHMDEITQLELKIQQVEVTIENWRKEIDVLKSAN